MSKTKSLRAMLKPTPIAKIKEKISEDDKMLGGREKTDYLEVEDGTNKFRLFPAHNPGDSFKEMRSVIWLDYLNKDGEKKRRTVMNAKIHGSFDRDIAELYVDMLRRKADSLFEDEEEAAKKLSLVTSWDKGLKFSFSWIAWANKLKGENKEFGLLEMKKSVRDDIDKECTFVDDDEPIDVDPFTDPDDGKILSIVYNSKAKKSSDYYSTKVLKTMPLTDEEIEHFIKNVTPLKDLVTNVYSVEEFERAVEGLKLYDETNDINLFEDEEWIELMEIVREEVESSSKTKKTKPSSAKTEEKAVNKTKDKKATETKTNKKTTKVEEVEEEEEEEIEEEDEGVDLDSMNREALKTFIKDNQLEVKVFKGDTEESLREKIRAVVEVEEEEAEEETEEEEDDDVAALEKIKAKLNKKK